MLAFVLLSLALARSLFSDDDVHYYICERLKLKRESIDRAPGENVVITLMRFADNERTLVCIKILTPTPGADLWSTRENPSCSCTCIVIILLMMMFITICAGD